MKEKFTEEIQITNKCEKAVHLSNQRNRKYMKWFWSVIATQIIIVLITKTGAERWGCHLVQPLWEAIWQHVSKLKVFMFF